jgi:site-specific recombinase XerD
MPGAVTPLRFGDVRDEIPAFVDHLEATNKSPRTIESYRETVEQLVAFLVAHELPTDAAKITNRHVEAWFRDLRDTGRSEATVALRFRSLRVFFNWCVSEEILEASPMRRVMAPKVTSDPVPVVPVEDVRKLLATCRTRAFEDVRDGALILVFFDTGARLSEIANITLDDLADDAVLVTRKGGDRQRIPLEPEIRVALRRYRRQRDVRPDARLPWLWLGKRGRLQPRGIVQMVKRRCAEAGIAPIHVHQFRHSAASLMLENGVAEGDVMTLMGWSPSSARTMLTRYTRVTADRRAKAAHERFSPRKLLDR